VRASAYGRAVASGLRLSPAWLARRQLPTIRDDGDTALRAAKRTIEKWLTAVDSNRETDLALRMYQPGASAPPGKRKGQAERLKSSGKRRVAARFRDGCRHTLTDIPL
jgi:hypothetical protein